MKNTLLEVFNTARAMLQGGDTDATIGFSNTQMQQFFNVAYPELWQIMAQVQTPRVRRDFFHYLPAYTTYFDPQAIGITDFGEPEWMEERGGVTTVLLSGTTNTTPIAVNTIGAHGLGSNMPLQIADVSGTTAPWGMWYGTYLSPTSLYLNGSTAPGAAGTGGKLMYSGQFFRRMVATRDMPFNSPISNYLRVYQWQDSALKFLGATQPIQIHITYWASAVPPTNVNTELGIDDCMAFLSTRVASLAAESRGWYEMTDRLARRALGPSMQADGSGGLLRGFLNIQVINMQGTEFRKPPFRTNNALNYPGDYIYGFFSSGSDSVSVGSTTQNPQGYYIVPVTSGEAALDLSLGNIQVVNLTAASTLLLTPENMQPGPFWVKLIQDSTGGRAVTLSSDYIDIDPTDFSGAICLPDTYVVLSLAVQDDLQISYLGITYGPTV
jgi:hypothetical protein